MFVTVVDSWQQSTCVRIITWDRLWPICVCSLQNSNILVFGGFLNVLTSGGEKKTSKDSTEIIKCQALYSLIS